ncbi:hypothetical protein [Acinetobacter sp. ANC 4973]|uniref:hypothetical protein n=1 Tax=Acinetobacter sp. ANC 4973 TaxID=1977871 RepID=UPI00222838AC|nr:hypothetical protein [Acinetobacter sp. ANC 4973]
MNYSHLQFFPKLCAFNIGWHEQPSKEINSYVTGSKGKLKVTPEPNPDYEKFYPDLL